MSVFKRGKTWYIDYWPNGRHGKHVREACHPGITTREEAEQYEKIVRNRPTEIQVSSVKIEDLFGSYLDHVRLHRAETTAVDVGLAWKNFISAILGRFAVQDVSQDHIEYYQSVRKKAGVSNRTINKEVSYLSAFLTWCRTVRKIKLQKINIMMLPYKRPKPRILSFAEVAGIFLSAPPFWRALFGCYYTAGLRYGTARYLRWEDVNIGSRYILFRQKGGEEKMLPIPEWLADCLAEMRQDRKEGWVFLNPATGRPVLKVSGALARACKAAGIERHVTPHMFRHSFATHLLKLKVNLRTIQDYLGHARISTTEIYTHVDMDDLREAETALTSVYARMAAIKEMNDTVYTLPTSKARKYEEVNKDS
jgi:integrase/recombinase XerD